MSRPSLQEVAHGIRSWARPRRSGSRSAAASARPSRLTTSSGSARRRCTSATCSSTRRIRCPAPCCRSRRWASASRSGRWAASSAATWATRSAVSRPGRLAAVDGHRHRSGRRAAHLPDVRRPGPDPAGAHPRPAGPGFGAEWGGTMPMTFEHARWRKRGLHHPESPRPASRSDCCWPTWRSW